MASSGPYPPGTAASVGTGTEWTTPDNALAADSAYAEIALPVEALGAKLALGDFGFAIPTGSTIVGVAVEVYDVTLTGSIFSTLYLTLDGINASGGSFHSLESGSGWTLYGGANDSWTLTLTAEQVNDPGFGIYIIATDSGFGSSAQVNSARITVYYSTDDDGPFLATIGGNAGAGTAWTNPGNVTADDGANATNGVGFSQSYQRLVGRGFGFAIPSDATIEGIVAAYADAAWTGIGQTRTCALSKDAGATVVPTTWIWGSSTGWSSRGTNTELHGTTWTPAEINSDDFAFCMYATAGANPITAAIDAIRMTVYYSVPQGPPPQTAAPDGDVTDGTWTNEAGSNVNLFASIDELVSGGAGDADFIKSGLSPASADVAQFSLGPITDPAVSTGHKVRYRYGKDQVGGDIIDLTVRLKQGGTTIASWVHSDIAVGPLDVEQTLTGGEADAITDYSLLELVFEAIKV